MAAENDNAIDPGLATLVILLRVHGVDTDADQIRNRYGTKAVRIREMLRYAKHLGLKAHAPTTRWERLASTSLPGIASLRDGGFLILGRVVADEVAVFRPSSLKPELMTRAEFEAIWDGRLVLMARRVSWLELARRYFQIFIGTEPRTRRLAQRALGAAGQHAIPRDRGATRWRVYHPWQGSRRPGPRAAPVIATSGGDGAG